MKKTEHLCGYSPNIKLHASTLNDLKDLKFNSEESYNSVVIRLLEIRKKYVKLLYGRGKK